MARKHAQPASKLTRFFSYIVVGIFGLFGSFVLFGLGLMLCDVYHAREWTPVNARLLSWQEQKLGAAGIRHRAGIDPLQALQVSYEYKFAGQSFTGGKASFLRGADNFSSDFRDSIKTRLRNAEPPEQAQLQVWVNPSNPEESVIERSLPLGSALFLSIILIFPCGLASVVLFYTLGSWLQLQRFSGCFWCMFHGSPAILIAWLSMGQPWGIAATILLAAGSMLAVSGVACIVRKSSGRSTG